MIMLNIKVSGSWCVKMPTVLEEKGVVQYVWSTDVRRIMHEAGEANNGQSQGWGWGWGLFFVSHAELLSLNLIGEGKTLKVLTQENSMV